MERLPLELIALCFCRLLDVHNEDHLAYSIDRTKALMADRAACCLLRREWLRTAQLSLHSDISFYLEDGADGAGQVHKLFERCRQDIRLAEACMRLALDWDEQVMIPHI